MNRKLSLLAALGLMTSIATGLQAHQMSEIYIPIGQSPGLSGTQTLIGEVLSVDSAQRTIEIEGPDGPRTVSVGDATFIWLDRSGSKRKNTYGSYADCKPGSRVEVKFTDPEDRAKAEWIKVEVND